jgi:hypothetical protein
MFDYYKINTVGLPKCTKSTMLFTHSNYECNYFLKTISLCLTSTRQIAYLVSSSIRNNHSIKFLILRIFFLSSIDVLLGIKSKMYRSKYYAI